MAISFVGASIIWNFMYEMRDGRSAQIGLLNSILVASGRPAPAWTALAPWNNLFLIVVVVWMQTGFAMVLFSAAFKGIPEDIWKPPALMAPTIDQVFFKIMIPSIIWDDHHGLDDDRYLHPEDLRRRDGDDRRAVWHRRDRHPVLSPGLHDPATPACGGAIAVVLLLAVMPVMMYNLRQFSEQEAFEDESPRRMQVGRQTVDV